MKSLALTYAEQGFRVIILEPRGKKPLTKHGSLDATSDPAIISKWWDDCPGGNIGLVMGHGFVAIDIDNLESLDKWESLNGALPSTMETITGSGGRHLIYKVPCNISNSANRYLGIDIRGVSGYVLAPGSIHPNGKRYQAVEDYPAYADDKVYDFLRYVQPVGGSSKRSGRQSALNQWAHSLLNKGLTLEEIRLMPCPL